MNRGRALRLARMAAILPPTQIRRKGRPQWIAGHTGTGRTTQVTHGTASSPSTQTIAGSRFRAPAPSPAEPARPKSNYVDLLITKHERTLSQRSSGIDYPAALARSGQQWPFAEVAKQLARHLGKSGGLSAFSSEELESLQKAHQRLPLLDASLLEQALQQAQQRTLPEIVFLLQQLHHDRSR